MPSSSISALGDGAIGSGALDGKCAAKSQAERFVHAEFVALGVSAEVVVIVENEDASLGSRCPPIEVRRSEPADTTADYDEIVGFPGVLGLAGRIPESAIAHAVRRLKRTRMATAHSGQRGRIVVGRFPRICRITAEQLPRHHRRTRGRSHAVDEVAARDLATHSQVPVP